MSDQDLHAFIDGELDPARRAEIALILDTDKVMAARAAAFRADKSAIAAAYAGLVHDPLPKEWLDRIARDGKAAPKPGRAARAYWFAGAALAMVVATFAGVQFLSERGSNERIVAEALDARADRTAAAKIVPAAALATAEARNQLVSATIGLNAKIPDLSRMNFRLESVKLYSAAGAAELVYRDGQGRLFTIYLRHAEGAERFDQFQRDELRVCIWQDETMGAVMSGPISGAEMMRLAALAYAGLVT